ncbi:hypothetical protein FM113_05800 [Leucobacter sp. 7(1)]|nr:hypothetical protein FM113_05800 [Leucobacter sp. 7(1)]
MTATLVRIAGSVKCFRRALDTGDPGNLTVVSIWTGCDLIEEGV